MVTKKEFWHKVTFSVFRREPSWELLKVPDEPDAPTVVSHWEQSILSQAQYLWPTGRLEIEYSRLVHGLDSTPDKEVTYYARLVWKKDLDAPHNAYLTLRSEHLNVPKFYATKNRTFSFRNVVLQKIDTWLRDELRERLGEKYEEVLVKSWGKESTDSLPAYKS